jgi:hypothetical protein
MELSLAPPLCFCEALDVTPLDVRALLVDVLADGCTQLTQLTQQRGLTAGQEAGCAGSQVFFGEGGKASYTRACLPQQVWLGFIDRQTASSSPSSAV